MENAINTGAVQ